MTRYPVAITRQALEARFEIAGRWIQMRSMLEAAGLPVPAAPASVAVDAGGVRVALVGPRRLTVAAPFDHRERLETTLQAARPLDAALIAADVTGATATFMLDGSGVSDVLAQGVAHDLASLSDGRIAATEGWGTGVLLERRNGCTFVTVDIAFADYIEHMLRSAAGQQTHAQPGVMRAPPPPIRVTL